MAEETQTEVQKLWQRVTAIEKNAADADKRIADLEKSAAAAAGQKDPEAHKKRAEFLKSMSEGIKAGRGSGERGA